MPRLKSSLNKNHLETKIVAVSNTDTVGFVIIFFLGAECESLYGPPLYIHSRAGNVQELASPLGAGEPMIRSCVPLPR